MKRTVISFIVISLFANCGCKKVKEEEKQNSSFEGVYVTSGNAEFGALIGNRSSKYYKFCMNVLSSNALEVGYLENKVQMAWEKLEEGKYKVSYQGKEVFLYDNGSKYGELPNSLFLLSLKKEKPLEKNTDDYSQVTKVSNYVSLDDCIEAVKTDLDNVYQNPAPGPENNWGKDK
ncbi:hypothetical protein EHQ52_19750 [Leptospira koniambonensis]|uniref:Uncharacterized protein n=1 Tax=Leptospira koniambonensis TaxID=2484950 RepID=A0A4R9J2H6_9LEPT|nr:hypothetical protein [Leptospira koniambonensis]TGL28498.1 hypothetical protein EHQ52_19750 [Leptospira koniambonensis]